MGSSQEILINTAKQRLTMETEFLIVGAGPAGASLGCFLARYGISGLMISAASGTADTPRAHINNMAALETLRDIGLWDDCKKLGVHGPIIRNYRWCESMSGEEYARNFAWGNGERMGDYEQVSPCHHMDLPQWLLEPILVRYATANGFKLRFDTELLSFIQDKPDGKITCSVKDNITGSEFQIVTKYLFGADGGRSVVAKQLDLPMTVIPGGGLAYNILVRADLGHLMQHREGILHWCLRLHRDYPFMFTGRMVKPWNEWMFVVFPKGPDSPVPSYSNEEWGNVVADYIDDPSVEVKVLNVSKWMINETSADSISKGNIFCLGDAIHRHPPTLGMGSNTSIQDSFNLAWKIALVSNGVASPKLLETYNAERQPVGAQLVKLSNDTLRKHIAVWMALGVMPPGSPEKLRLATIRALKENSPKGREARKNLKEKVDDMQHETHALGIEMGQTYVSRAVYSSDELGPYKSEGKEAEDPQLFYTPSTYPGRRLPHVWLNTPIPGNMVSTLDVAGKGGFSLFTGIGGDGWKAAAEGVSKELGMEIKSVSIGPGQDWEDAYLDWVDKRGVQEDGAVLVRPDFFVAWRANESGNELERLRKALKSVLHLS
ncbi:hypothetical protein CC78DRAFT_490816 [Lojkania enalia]|uniref:FAD-binding domain-containing protein n=1 Tax=Lojkania enalia TaxID=147567 RepID=A0A9P4KE14_9PLEO|nr:hypothetical protein CC78DRAFT_490816 [Didymosphaeria enalia]